MLTHSALVSIVVSPSLRLVGEPGEGTSTVASHDGHLVARLRRGDSAAAHSLYSRHVAAVLARTTRLLGRHGEAEDAVQDAFFEAFRDLDQLKDDEHFGAWLRGIAVHQVHRRFRKRRLLARLGLDRGASDATLAGLASEAATPEMLTQLAELDQALARLPAGPRLVWMLRHVEGCTLPEVAAQCRCSVAAVKRRLTKAEHTLKKTYSGAEPTDE